MSGLTCRACRPLWALTLALSLALWMSVTAGTASANTGPYDEAADAQAQIQQALAEAVKTQQPVLLVFGANWCGDCKVLDSSFRAGRLAALMNDKFKLVKVNVGRFDRNVDIAQRYGVPLKKGIPAVALVSATGQLLYNTAAGELADARNMGEPGIHDFFTQLAAQHTGKKP